MQFSQGKYSYNKLICYCVQFVSVLLVRKGKKTLERADVYAYLVS
jgi:hypothetical protein